MKKLIVLALLIALCAGIAFADGISIGAWGRGIYAPVVTTGAALDKIGPLTGASWGGSSRIGFGVTGNSEFVGFIVQLKALDTTTLTTYAFNNGTTVNTGVPATDLALVATTTGQQLLQVNDEASIWVKPFPGLKIQIGRSFDDTLRGSAGFGSYNWIRAFGVAQFGDDFVFARVGNTSGDIKYTSAVVSFAMSGFFAYVEQDFPSNITYYGDTTATTGNPLLKNGNDPINSISFGAGYTVEGIGQFRAQKKAASSFDGPWTTGGTDGPLVNAWGQYQIAAKITAVKDLMVDVGVQIPDNSIAVVDLPINMTIPLYVTYKIAGVNLSLAGSYTSPKNGDAPIMAALGVGYDLGAVGLAGYAIDADIRYQNKASTGGTKDMAISFLAGITKGFSNGLVGLGLQVATQASGDKTLFALPIRLEYWF